MTTNSAHGIVITTFADENTLLKCVNGLLQLRLAACVQQLDAKSSYRWEGKIARDNEILVLIKTRSDLYDSVERYIKANHPYEVPEIIFVPITNGSATYLGWLNAECDEAAEE